MAGLTDKEKEALQLFKQQLEQEFADQIQSIQLFGSKARGDATKFSDVDVLVVMNDTNFDNRMRVSSAATDVLLETGVVLSVKKLTPEQLDEMQQHKSMFWQSIQPDLISI